MKTQDAIANWGPGFVGPENVSIQAARSRVRGWLNLCFTAEKVIYLV